MTNFTWKHRLLGAALGTLPLAADTVPPAPDGTEWTRQILTAVTGRFDNFAQMDQVLTELPLDFVEWQSGIYFNFGDALKLRGVRVSGGAWEREFQEYVTWYDPDWQHRMEQFADNGIAVRRDGTVLDFDGRPEYLGSFCHSALKWRTFQHQGLLRPLGYGADTISQDNLNVMGFLYDRGSFCRWCLGNFNGWLAAHGTEPVAPDFNFKTYLERLPVSSGPEVLNDGLVRAYILYQNDTQLGYMREGRAKIKEECRRLGRPAAPFYGNQNCMLRTPYSMIQSGWVDVVWTEDGLSRPFPGDGRSANCTLRYKEGIASGDYRRPLWMCLYGHDRDEKRLLWSEALANGGVVVYSGTEPEYSEYARWIDAHRHLFRERDRMAKVALIDPLVSRIWDWYPELGLHGRTTAPELLALARILEEAQIPYEVICLYPPALRTDTVGLEKLREFPVLVMPEAECLSDTQIAALRGAMAAGAALVTSGPVGNLDENRRSRDRGLEGGISIAAEIDAVLQAEKTDDPGRVAAIREAARKLRQIPGAGLVRTEAPETLWVNLYSHRAGRRLALHLLNYDYIEGIVTPARDVSCQVTLPEGFRPEICRLSSPDFADFDVPVTVNGTVAAFTVPEVRTYVVASLGNDAEMRAAAELEAARTAHLRLETAGIASDADRAELLRLQDASDGEIAARAPGLTALWRTRLQEYRENVVAERNAIHDEWVAAGAQAALALNFGSTPIPGWQTMDGTACRAERGFGWVAGSPEMKRDELGNAPALGREYLSGEHPARLRVDLPEGHYRATLVTGESNAKIHFDALVDVRVNDRLAVVGIPRRGGMFRADSFEFDSDGSGTVIELTGRPGWESATYPRSWSADAIWFEALPAPASAPADTWLRDWYVSNPIADPDWTGLETAGAVTTEYPVHSADPVAAVDPVAVAGGDDESVYRVRCEFDSPEAQKARLTFSAQARARVQLNGVTVLDDFKSSGLEMAENTVEVELAAGRNRLTATVTQDWIGAAFLARLEPERSAVAIDPVAVPAVVLEEPEVYPGGAGLVQGAPIEVVLRTVNHGSEKISGRFTLTADPEMAEMVRIVPETVVFSDVAPGAAAEGVFTVEMLRPLNGEWQTSAWKMKAPAQVAFTAGVAVKERERSRRFRLSGITPALSWQWRDEAAGRGAITVGNPLTQPRNYRVEAAAVPGWKLELESAAVTVPAGGDAVVAARVVPDGSARPGEILLPVRLIPDTGSALTLEIPLVTRGIVGQWKFDENDAVIRDSSVNAHHGTLVAGMRREATPRGGNAIAFAEAMTAVSIPWPVRITDAVTVAAWVRLDALVPNNIIVAKTGRYGEGEFLLYVNESGRLTGRIMNGLDETTVTGRQLELGRWYFVAMVWTPERLTLYCDGEAVGGNKGYAGKIGLNDQPLLLGGGAYAGGVIGAIDDVTIGNYAMTPAEIKELMRK